MSSLFLTCLFASVLASTNICQEFEIGENSTIRTEDLHYTIRVPKNIDGKNGNPAILFIHGSNMRGENYIASLATYSVLRDWILIGPTGPKPADGNENAHNHSPGDERYVEEVLADVEQRLKGKINRLYVGGHSQGAFLSHAVAARLTDRVDGVLAVSGGTWVSPRKLVKKRKGKSKQLVPVAIVHGQDDPVVSFPVSVNVYDQYIAAGHEDVRLFGPTEGAHMFLRLPIDAAIDWLNLMNETDPENVRKVLQKTDSERHPRLAWDAAVMSKRLAKGGKHSQAQSVQKQIEKLAAGRAKGLQKRLAAVKGPLDPDLRTEAWTFLSDYGMVEGNGAWRKALAKAVRRE